MAPRNQTGSIVPPSAVKAVMKAAEQTTARKIATPAGSSGVVSSSSKDTTTTKTNSLVPLCQPCLGIPTGIESEMPADELSTGDGEFQCPQCTQMKPLGEKVVPLYCVSEQAVPLRGIGS